MRSFLDSATLSVASGMPTWVELPHLVGCAMVFWCDAIGTEMALFVMT